MKTNEIMSRLQVKYPGEKEYLQAVQEVLESIEEVYNRHPEFEAAKEHLGADARCEEDVLSYISFPQVAEKFFDERKAREEKIVRYTITEA